MVQKDGKIKIDLEDDVTGRSIVTHEKKKLWPNPKPLPMLDAKKTQKKKDDKKEIK